MIMATGPRYKVPFRRRREGRTDYRRRAKLVKSGMHRAVVRRSNRHMTVQFVSYDSAGDRIVAAAVSTELVKLGWKHSGKCAAGAYLTGYLAGKRALGKGVDEAVLDLGLREPVRGSVLFAAMKGIVDAGVEIPHDEEMVPPEERLKGKHLKDGAEVMFEDVKGKIGGAE